MIQQGKESGYFDSEDSNYLEGKGFEWPQSFPILGSSTQLCMENSFLIDFFLPLLRFRMLH